MNRTGTACNGCCWRYGCSGRSAAPGSSSPAVRAGGAHNHRDQLVLALDAAFELLTKEAGGQIQAAYAVGELYAIGAKKYAKRNWEQGIDWGVVWSAAFRHLLAHIIGEKNDPVDGQLHLTSVCCNIIALLHYTGDVVRYGKFDSRKDVVVAENKGQK